RLFNRLILRFLPKNGILSRVLTFCSKQNNLVLSGDYTLKLKKLVKIGRTGYIFRVLGDVWAFCLCFFAEMTFYWAHKGGVLFVIIYKKF
ncbi:MAG: hypothetical protein J5608_01845, partial [Alphaproteobacteria bacterium]|nr:hypothetical protein [Alphaproteobacteria bacterium]